MFKFVVEWYDELTKKVVTTAGILAANDYLEAVKRLVEYYHEEYLINIKELCPLVENLLSEEEITSVFA